MVENFNKEGNTGNAEWWISGRRKRWMVVERGVCGYRKLYEEIKYQELRIIDR